VPTGAITFIGGSPIFGERWIIGMACLRVGKRLLLGAVLVAIRLLITLDIPNSNDALKLNSASKSDASLRNVTFPTGHALRCPL
jgi:hypothetical protein